MAFVPTNNFLEYKKFFGEDIINPLQTYYRDVFIRLTKEFYHPSNVPYNEPVGNFASFDDPAKNFELPFTTKEIPVVIHLVRNSTNSSDPFYESNYQSFTSSQIDYLFNLLNLIRPGSDFDNYIKFNRAGVDDTNNILPTPGFNIINANEVTRSLNTNNGITSYSYSEWGVAIRGENVYAEEPTPVGGSIKGVLPQQITNLTETKFPTSKYLNIYIVNAIRNPIAENLTGATSGGQNISTYAHGVLNAFADKPLVIPPLYGEVFNNRQNCGVFITYNQLAMLDGSSGSNISKWKNWTPTDTTFGTLNSNYFKTDLSILANPITTDYQKNGVQILKSLVHYLGLRDPSFYNIINNETKGFCVTLNSSSQLNAGKCMSATNYGDGVADTPSATEESQLNVSNTSQIFLHCESVNRPTRSVPDSNLDSQSSDDPNVFNVGERVGSTNILYTTVANEIENNLLFSFTNDQLKHIEYNFNYSIDGEYSILTELVGNTGSLQFIYGCMDETATNYNPDADIDDGSCFQGAIILGCMQEGFVEYNQYANTDNGTCVTPAIYGCIYNVDNVQAVTANYNPLANLDDGSCLFWYKGCTNPLYVEYNPDADIDNGSCLTLIDQSNIMYLTSDTGGCTYNENNLKVRDHILNTNDTLINPVKTNLLGFNIVSSLAISSFFKVKVSINNLVKIITYGG
tara:strand:+ start:2539 stop:4596 length:2058 start_codon:yes stop_codon:yes gene_type:complete